MANRTWWDIANEMLVLSRKLVQECPRIAYFLAMFSVELALKHVLKCNDDFIDASKSQGGDRHHNLNELAEKVGHQLTVPAGQRLATLVGNVETVHIRDSSGQSEYYCTAAESAQIKYLTEPEPSELDAEQKLQEAEILLQFLSQTLGFAR